MSDVILFSQTSFNNKHKEISQAPNNIRHKKLVKIAPASMFPKNETKTGTGTTRINKIKY